MSWIPGARPIRIVRWMGSSRNDLRAMPEAVREEFGAALYEVQCGQTPVDARPFGEGLPRAIYKLAEHFDGEACRIQGGKSSLSEQSTTNGPMRTRAKKADLGLSNADELLAKSELALAIRDIVRTRGWTQVIAARTLSIPASDMSDLMRGKLTRFGRERLEDFLVRLGVDVQIRLTPKAKNRAKARISVVLDSAT